MIKKNVTWIECKNQREGLKKLKQKIITNSERGVNGSPLNAYLIQDYLLIDWRTLSFDAALKQQWVQSWKKGKDLRRAIE